MSEKKPLDLFLELGQIIQINAPKNQDINNHIFVIDYLDNNIIKLIDNDDLSIVELKLIDHKFTDESIETIYILANPEEKRLY